MTDAYFDCETYIKIDFSKTKIKKGEYDNCTFINCNFENIHASNIQDWCAMKTKALRPLNKQLKSSYFIFNNILSMRGVEIR